MVRTIYAADGSHVIDAGDGYVFGPYGPGRCEATHPGSGMRCAHGKNHAGCHSAYDERTPVGEFTHRWQ